MLAPADNFFLDGMFFFLTRMESPMIYDQKNPLWMQSERVQIDWWRNKAIEHSQRIAELTQMLGGGYRIPSRGEVSEAELYREVVEDNKRLRDLLREAFRSSRPCNCELCRRIGVAVISSHCSTHNLPLCGQSPCDIPHPHHADDENTPCS